MRSRLAAPLVLASLLALPAAAEPTQTAVSLRPRYQPGDAYVLSLSDVRSSELLARGDAGKAVREDVHLRYEANVVVLETDAAGIPLRERHQDVALSFVRPDGSGSLFDAPTSYEVRRSGGAAQVFVDGERAPRKLEKVVSGILDDQFEYGVGALVDPGRTVAVGESWEIERGRVKRFLRQRGIEGVRLAEPARATLERRGGDAGPLVLHYSIPIRSFRPKALPESAHAARSQGSLEGELRLDPERLRAPLRHSSKLALHMNGSVFGAQVTRPFPFSFRSSESLDQHTLSVHREVAGSF